MEEAEEKQKFRKKQIKRGDHSGRFGGRTTSWQFQQKPTRGDMMNDGVPCERTRSYERLYDILDQKKKTTREAVKTTKGGK